MESVKNSFRLFDFNIPNISEDETESTSSDDSHYAVDKKIDLFYLLLKYYSVD